MPMETIPWSVGGGIHSPALARMLAYQATSGSEGIAGIGDFLVTQLAVAGGAVQIGAGGGIMVSRYPGARNESYMCRAGDSTTLAVPQNAGGSTRYDLVIARVDDWNMPGGQATPAVLPTNEVPAAMFQLITNVPASTKTAKQLGLNYPAIALARIAVPAATSAITQAMITDLREMAVPRRKRVVLTKALVAGQEDAFNTAAPAVEVWPDAAIWPVEVPEWATRVRVIAMWSGVNVPAGSTRSGGLYAYIGQGNAAGFATQKTGLKAPGSTQPGRATVSMSDDVAIPAGLRGVTSNMQLMGSLDGGAGGYPTIDSYSSVSLDLEFLEAPAQDA